MYGEKELVKCYKCEYYHDKDDKHIKEVKDGETKKWLCNTCRDFSIRSKDDLRIKTSFDNTQQTIIKDLAYRIRLLELEDQGKQAKIEKLENELKKPYIVKNNSNINKNS